MSISKNKTALITGVSRRKSIGYGIANRLASQGLNLFLHSFTEYDKMMSLNIAADELELIYSITSKVFVFCAKVFLTRID
ncbi:hypothetical protein H8E88_04365 [candidate division KSB1 bacterium]|nr:hypothetical protein [candidate division KSB1 bacterium]MBL7095013.1 hypothetical protein [candidate division KSB1 bacterium]